MEDDLKILKSKYLINHWQDISQIVNLSSGDQTKIKNTLNEDNLKWNNKFKYLSHHWQDIPSILNFSSGD